MITQDDVHEAALRFFEAVKGRDILVATAESCTGGLVAAALTNVAGSSANVDRGFVTYSNEAKIEMLGVSPPTLEAHGAVSAETAREMVEGALARSRAQLAVSITGIAGPGGGSETKPVGLVWFAAAAKDGRVDLVERRFGDIGREQVRARSVIQALGMLTQLAGGAVRAA